MTKSEYTGIKNQIHSRDLTALFCQSFRRNKKDNTNSAHYAQAQYDENDTCYLRNDEGLCSLQLQCGHEALPYTCRIFPRSEAIIWGTVERQLSLGCEGVTSLLMEEKSGISFEETSTNKHFHSLSLFISETKADLRPVLHYIWDIKTLGAAILQDRTLSLDDRMIALGIVMRKISSLEQENTVDLIPQFIDQVIKSDAKDLIPEEVISLTLDPTISIISAILFLKHIGVEQPHHALNPQLQNIYHMIDTTGEMTLEERMSAEELQEKINDSEFSMAIDLSKYAAASSDYQEWLQEYEYFVENIMVSYFFHKQIPFCSAQYNIWDHFVYFSDLYNLLKLILKSSLNAGSDASEIVQAVTKYSRSLAHSSKNIEYLIDLANKTDSNSLAHMAILIKS